MITPMLASLVSCGSHLPPRKMGEFVNVTFIGHEVDCNCPTYAPIGRDLDLVLNIPFRDHEDATWEIEPTKESEGMLDKPVEEYYVSPDDIKVTIAGHEYPEAWYFYYRHNNDNLLKIKKEYVVNDITIEVTSRPFGSLYLYGIVVGEEMLNRWTEHKDKPGDDPTIYTHDLYIELGSFYQRKQYPIKTIDGQYAFPVFEHDNIDITFKVKDDDESHPPLPDDIRFRCNSRYTYMGLDYTREYSDLYEYIDEAGHKTLGYRTCHLTVPHYIVMDHVSFRQYGTE